MEPPKAGKTKRSALSRRTALIVGLCLLPLGAAGYWRWHQVSQVVNSSRGKFESATRVTIEGQVSNVHRSQIGTTPVKFQVEDSTVIRELAKIVYGGISPKAMLEATTEDRKYASAVWLSIQAWSNDVPVTHVTIVSSQVIVGDYDMSHARDVAIYDDILNAAKMK